MQSGITRYSLKKTRRVYHKPMHTNVTTSFATGDDGNSQKGNADLVNFSTLKLRNCFGNFLRFTDINGRATVPGTTTYTIDHFTGLGFSLGQAANTWAIHVAAALTFSVIVGGQTLSGFWLPNIKELDSIRRYDSTYGLEIVAETQDNWTSVTDVTNTANAIVAASSLRFTGVIKTSATRKAIYFRNHF